MTFFKNTRCCSNCAKVQSAMPRKLESWTSNPQSILDIPPLQTLQISWASGSSIFHTPPLQAQQIPPQRKSQKG